MYCKHCGKEIADDSKFCRYCGTNQISECVESSPMDSQANEVAAESVESINNEVVEEPMDNPKQSIDSKPIVEAEDKPKAPEVRPFPLVRRIFGSMIEEILVLIFTIVVYVAIHPYSGPGDIGFFMGIMNNSPSNYEYVDKYQIDNYGKVREGVDIEYQINAMREMDAPYIGYTKDFDIKIASIIILANVLYYIIFGFRMRSTLIKALLGGRIVDTATNNRASFGKILLRGILWGAFAALSIWIVRFYLDLSYYMVTFVFILFMELPLFYTKRSLIDWCTNTVYIDAIKKEDLKGRYGEPDILVKKKQLKNK